MFKAAPFLKLSDTTHKFKPFSTDSSSLILEIKVLSSQTQSIGVIYSEESEVSTLHPGASDRIFIASLL